MIIKEADTSLRVFVCSSIRQRIFVVKLIVPSNIYVFVVKTQNILHTDVIFVPPFGDSVETENSNRRRPPQKIELESHTLYDKDITTPICHKQLEFYLEGYNVPLKRELINGFKHGFDLGFRGTPNSNIKVKNLKSTLENPNKVNEKIDKELHEERLYGPFVKPSFSSFQINPIGLVPKKEANSFRIITNLSSPEGKSINDNIPDEFKSVQYASIQDAIEILIALGTGAFMAKTDIKSAFRLMPIKKDNWNLLGLQWDNKFYFDKCLPMGARSSCQLFEKFSTSLEFIAKKLGVKFMLHYLDDFIFLNHSYDKCLEDLNLFLKICNDIRVPLAPEKTILPVQNIEFLGFELDTNCQIIRLPEEKINKCKLAITNIEKDKASLKEL